MLSIKAALWLKRYIEYKILDKLSADIVHADDANWAVEALVEGSGSRGVRRLHRSAAPAPVSELVIGPLCIQTQARTNTTTTTTTPTTRNIDPRIQPPNNIEPENTPPPDANYQPRQPPTATVSAVTIQDTVRLNALIYHLGRVVTGRSLLRRCGIWIHGSMDFRGSRRVSRCCLFLWRWARMCMGIRLLLLLLSRGMDYFECNDDWGIC